MFWEKSRSHWAWTGGGDLNAGFPYFLFFLLWNNGLGFFLPFVQFAYFFCSFSLWWLTRRVCVRCDSVIELVIRAVTQTGTNLRHWAEQRIFFRFFFSTKNSAGYTVYHIHLYGIIYKLYVMRSVMYMLLHPFAYAERTSIVETGTKVIGWNWWKFDLIHWNFAARKEKLP